MYGAAVNAVVAPKSKSKPKSSKAKAKSSKAKAKSSKAKSSKAKTPTKTPAHARPAVVGEALSCGLLLFQQPTPSSSPLVLVLWRKDGSPDLPKGHTKRGESDVAAALRELHEETGVLSSRVHITPDFAFENTYRTRSKKVPGALVNKTVRVFHATVASPVRIEPLEHAGYAWLPTDDARWVQHELHDNPTFVGALRAWRHFCQRQA
jgi:8-oxo-dGTP pyrophosphatase MutT (NUDIX family)